MSDGLKELAMENLSLDELLVGDRVEFFKDSVFNFDIWKFNVLQDKFVVSRCNFIICRAAIDLFNEKPGVNELLSLVYKDISVV